MNLNKRLAELLQWKKDHTRVHELEQKAVDVAYKEMLERLREHNGIEPRLKAWFEKLHDELVKRLESLEKTKDEQSGRQEPISGLVRWVGTVLAALAVLVVVWFIGHVMK